MHAPNDQHFADLYRQAAERRREAHARWLERQRVRWHPPPPPPEEDASDEEPAA